MTDMWAHKLRMSYLTGFSSLLDLIPFPKLYPPSPLYSIADLLEIDALVVQGLEVILL